ncbi:MAG: DUF4180 domain-containing protein [Treponema sp.]|jgi:hypothetical protein|nr:DUF4180 domain-containing protein [Treponema sp.]
MRIKFHKNEIIEFIDNETIINNADDVFTLFITHKCLTTILKRENIIGDFFNLSTEIAGEILQKFSNYNKRMAILGDFSNKKSKSLRDFIYESNKTKQIIFVDTIEIFNREYSPQGVGILLFPAVINRIVSSSTLPTGRTRRGNFGHWSDIQYIVIGQQTSSVG